MRKFFVAAIAAITLAAASVGLAFAQIASPCDLNQGSNNVICLYEDSGGGGDNIYIIANAGTNLPAVYSLTTVSTGLHSGCNSWGGGHASTWNDCPSSWRIKIGSTYCGSFWTDAGYSGIPGAWPVYWGPQSGSLHNAQVESVDGDTMTSFKVWQKSPPTPAGNC